MISITLIFRQRTVAITFQNNVLPRDFADDPQRRLLFHTRFSASLVSSIAWQKTQLRTNISMSCLGCWVPNTACQNSAKSYFAVCPFMLYLSPFFFSMVYIFQHEIHHLLLLSNTFSMFPLLYSPHVRWCLLVRKKLHLQDSDNFWWLWYRYVWLSLFCAVKPHWIELNWNSKLKVMPSIIQLCPRLPQLPENAWTY